MNSYSLVSQKNQEKVTYRIETFSNILSKTNFYQFSRESNNYQEFKSHLVNFVVNAYERKENKRFHESLNFFKKMGFFVSVKEKDHIKNIEVKKAILSFGVDILLTLLPAGIDYFLNRNKIEKLKEFFIGIAAKVNQINTLKIQKKIYSFFKRNFNYDISSDDYRRIFEKWINGNYWPMLELESQNKVDIFSFFVSFSNLSDNKVIFRLKDLGVNYFSLPEDEVDEIIKRREGGDRLVSDAVATSSLISMFFDDVVKSLKSARQHSLYCLENDPYAQERQKYRQVITRTGKVALPVALGALTFWTGPIGDALLTASAPILTDLFWDGTLDRTIKVHEKLNYLKKQLKKGV